VLQAKINSLQRRGNEPGYQAECQVALDPFYRALVKMAARAGWREAEVATALIMLAAKDLKTLATMEKPVD